MVKSGIYKITNIENGKVYIGSSKNVNERIDDHLCLLRKNDHANSYLQNAWNKYREEKFESEVIEFVPDVNILLEREQFWMDKTQCYKREFGYNILPVAGSRLGSIQTEEAKRKMSGSKKGQPSPMKGKSHTQDTKDKMSKSKKGRPAWNKGIPRTQEEKDKMSESQKGRPSPMKGKSHTQDTKDKIAMAKGNGWVINSPNGDEFIVTNLNEFCRDNNLCSSAMVEVSKGKRSHNKGWKCRKIE